jgi:hypothetical protein
MRYKIILILSCLLLIGCNAEETSAKESEQTEVKEVSKAPKIKKVAPCWFDYDTEDLYCRKSNIILYEKHLGDTPNFNKKFTIIKINSEDKDKFRLVALDQIEKIVYPLSHQISKKSNVRYSTESKEICVYGDVYAYSDSYEDSKVCFLFEFDKTFGYGFYQNGFAESLDSIEDEHNELKLENGMNSAQNFKFSELPYDSRRHLNCFRKNIECKGMELYSSDNLNSTYSFANDSYGDSVLIKNDNKNKVIMLSLSEEGEGIAVIVLNIADNNNKLIEEKHIAVGKNGYVRIDENLNLEYKDFTGVHKEKL